MDDYRNSPTIKFCADLFPAHRWPSIKFKKILERASVVAVAYRRCSFITDSNCKALIGKILVFWMGGRLWEVVALEVRQYCRNWECFDQSCVNRSESVHGTLGLLFLSHLLYLHYESVYFEELHNDQEYYWATIYRAGAAVVSTSTSR